MTTTTHHPIVRVLLGAAFTLILAPTSAQMLPDFSGLVEETKDSVVSIYSTKIVREKLRIDPFFAPFFGLPPDKLGERERRISGLGSGVILSSNGYIMTNAHVIEGAEDLQVELADDRKFEATVIGFDKLTDIAIVKIETDELLPIAKIGRSAEIKVGQWVIAIGSPFGLSHTVTAGIISAVARNLPTDVYVSFIQTDAPVNPGNSGGPLINMKGEVIGINSQIISQTGSYTGYSLAVPIDLAMEVQQRLRAEGMIQRGRLGVVFALVDEAARKTFGLPEEIKGGVVINEVIADSGAARAGIMVGDVIVKYDGKEITKHIDLPRLVADNKPDTIVEVELWRAGRIEKLAVTLGALAPPNLVQAPDAGGFETPLGMNLSDVPADLGQKLGLTGGVLFNGFVEKGTIKQDLRRLELGDIILAVVIDQRVIPVKSAAELRSRLRGIEHGYIGFRVKRGNNRPFFINVNLDS